MHFIVRDSFKIGPDWFSADVHGARMVSINLCIGFPSCQSDKFTPARRDRCLTWPLYQHSLNLFGSLEVFLVNRLLFLSPLLQTAAVTGTLPHPGHKTLRK